MAKVADNSRLLLLHLAPSCPRLTQPESRNPDAVNRGSLSSKLVSLAQYSAELSPGESPYAGTASSWVSILSEAHSSFHLNLPKRTGLGHRSPSYYYFPARYGHHLKCCGFWSLQQRKLRKDLTACVRTDCFMGRWDPDSCYFWCGPQ